jgi:hypothetical protein
MAALVQHGCLHARRMRKIRNLRSHRAITLPGLVNADFSIDKSFRFGERCRLELRSEFSRRESFNSARNSISDLGAIIIRRSLLWRLSSSHQFNEPSIPRVVDAYSIGVPFGFQRLAY